MRSCISSKSLFEKLSTCVVETALPRSSATLVPGKCGMLVNTYHIDVCMGYCSDSQAVLKRDVESGNAVGKRSCGGGTWLTSGARPPSGVPPVHRYSKMVSRCLMSSSANVVCFSTQETQPRVHKTCQGTCWQCGRTPEDYFLCGKCGTIQPPKEDVDIFQLFG